MIVNKPIQTVLGIKNYWYRRLSYNSDTRNMLKPDHHHKSVLYYLIYILF